MIDALRAEGYEDVNILDLAHAIAAANQWARMSRLLGLDPALFSLAGADRGVPVERAVGA